MAITAISSVSVSNNLNNTIQFGARKNKMSEGVENPMDTTSRSHKASGMVTIPTALFLALASQSISAAEMPVEGTSGVEQVRTEYVQQSNKVQLNKKPYRLIRNIPVKEVIPTTCYGEPYNLIYAGGKANDNVVDVVYLAPATYDGTRKGKNNKPKETLPPVVTMMRYHNLPDGKEIMGLVTYEEVYDKDNNVWLDTRIENKVLPECANPLIDLITGDTKWEYKGRIKFEETDSPKLLPIKQERIY